MTSDFNLILGDQTRSSWSLCAWLMLKYTGAKFDQHIIKLYQPNTAAEILKYSPSGKIPVLKHKDNLIWDSLAIGEYLNELFPESGLWPQDQIARAYARSISSEMHSGFATFRSFMPFNLEQTRSISITPELTKDIDRVEQIWLECRTKHSSSGQYLFNKFTIADAMFATVVLRFKTYGIKSNHEDVRNYCQTILNNQFIRQWYSQKRLMEA